MKRLLILQQWPFALLLLVLGMSAALFAWTTLNLLTMAVANFELIRNYGIMGLADGGLVQFIEIGFSGVIALSLFLLFKACEVEIIARWRGLEKSNVHEDNTEEM